MLLQHYFDGALARTEVRGLALVAAFLLLTGCAASSQKEATGGGQQATTTESTAAVGDVEIPAEAAEQFDLAVADLANGKTAEAQLRLQELLLRYPDYPGVYVNLAIISHTNADYDDAMANIERALELDPEHAAALNQKGLLHRKNGNFAAAEDAYLKAVTASPDYALAHYNLGVLNELYLQRLDVALQHFEAYQALVGSDQQVDKWIADLRRRVAANQRTANVAE